MAQLKIPVWGACPIITQAIPPKEKRIFDPDHVPQPETMIAACLGPACGFWKISKVKEEGGQVIPVEGMCGVRFLGEVFNSIAGSLESLVKMQGMREIREGASPIFGSGGGTPPPKES